MFESVRLRNGTLELTMRDEYSNTEGLLDRLAKYMRARIPGLKGIEQMVPDGSVVL